LHYCSDANEKSTKSKKSGLLRVSKKVLGTPGHLCSQTIHKRAANSVSNLETFFTPIPGTGNDLYAVGPLKVKAALCSENYFLSTPLTTPKTLI
jgi:hypothetical protein